MEDIISAYQKSSGDKRNLQNIPASVRGITVGIKYLHFILERIFNSPQVSKFTSNSFEIQMAAEE